MSDQGVNGGSQPNWMPPPPPSAQPGWQPQPPPYGAPPGQPGYPPYGYGYVRPTDTNGFAIASLVCSLVGIFVLVIGPLLGIIFGVVGLKQIPRLGQAGRGLAIAGITIGAIILFLDVVGLIAMATDSSTTGPGGVSV